MIDFLFDVPYQLFGNIFQYCEKRGGGYTCSFYLPRSPRRERLIKTIRKIRTGKAGGNPMGKYCKISTQRAWSNYVYDAGIIFSDDETDLIKSFWPDYQFRQPRSTHRWTYLSSVLSESDESLVSFDHDFYTICEGVFQTIRGFVVSIGKPKRLMQFLRNRCPDLITEDPDGALEELKKVVDYAESLFFDETSILDSRNRFFILKQFLTTDLQRIQARYMKRCLPHPRRNVPSINSYVDRVSQEPSADKDYEQEFHQWCESFFRLSGFKPSPLSFTPSCRGCMEHTSSAGGQSVGYKDIINYQILRIRAEKDSEFDDWAKDNDEVYFYLSENNTYGRLMTSSTPVCNPLPFFNEDVFSQPTHRRVTGTDGSYWRRNKKDAVIPEWIRKIPTRRISSQLRSRPVCLDGKPTVVASLPHKPFVPFQHKTHYKDVGREWSVARAKSILLIAGSLNLLKLKASPLVITRIKDRGGKYRIPTMTWIPALVCGGILRNIIDQYIRSEHSFQPCFGVDLPMFRKKKNLLIRSLDLSKATDLHSYNLTRGVYESLLRVHPKLDELPKGFAETVLSSLLPKSGGRPIFIRDKKANAFGLTSLIKREKCLWPMFLEMYQRKPLLYRNCGFTLDKLPSYFKDENILRVPLTYRQADERINCFEKEYTDFVSTFGLKFKGQAKKGPPMGEPLAFPVMPLLSLFTYEGAHEEHFGIQCCGDDAVAYSDVESSLAWSRNIERLGGEVNLSKDHLHPCKSLFTEKIAIDGVLTGFPFAPFFSIPTSKWEVNYYTLGGVSVSLKKRVEGSERMRVRLVEHSRVFPEVLTLWDRGVPVGLPHHFFGLDLKIPRFSRDSKTIRVIDLYELMMEPGDPHDPGIVCSWSPEHKSAIGVRRQAFNEVKPYVNCTDELANCKWNFSKAIAQRCGSAYALASMSGTALLFKDKACPAIEQYIAMHNKFLKKGSSTFLRRETNEIIRSYDRKRNFPLPDFEPKSGDNLALGASNFWGEYHIRDMYSLKVI